MKLDIGLSARARFQAIVHKGDVENPVEKTGWFDNIVLDSGLQRMKVNTWYSGISVGSGNSTPVVTQVGLDSYINRTTTTSVNVTVGSSVDEDSRQYFWQRMTYRFGAGAAAGNISEVGLSWGTGDSLWNRALVKNNLGNPTTITVLSDEYLDISVEIRFYLKYGGTGSFDVLDAIGNVASSHNYSIMPYSRNEPTTGGIGAVSPSHMTLYTGEYTGVIGSPEISGRIGNTGRTSIANSDLLQVSGRFTFDLTSGVGAIKTMVLALSGFGFNTSSPSVLASFGYAFVLDVPIVKTNTERLTVDATINWGRDTGA